MHATTELSTAGEAQRLVPPAVGAVVMCSEVRGASIVDIGIGLEGKALLEEAEGGTDIPLELEGAKVRAEDTQLPTGGEVQPCAFATLDEPTDEGRAKCRAGVALCGEVGERCPAVLLTEVG